jgi:hypothetical protein
VTEQLAKTFPLRGTDATFGFALEGHARSDVGDAYGSDGYPLSVRVLADAITKVPNPLEQSE